VSNHWICRAQRLWLLPPDQGGV